MAVTIIQIKRWYNMLLGKSVEHVNQDIGKFFKTDEVKGYYNNLTQKVTLMPELLYSDKLPEIKQLDGHVIFFLSLYFSMHWVVMIYFSKHTKMSI